MISGDEKIYRLVWHSFDFKDDGSLKGSAFSSSDLRPDREEDGTKKFVSTDRAMLLSKPSVDWRINHQQADGKRERLLRFEAKFAEFNCGELRSIKKDEQQQFDLTSEPEAEGSSGPGSPENPAHCALRHISNFTNKSHVDYLRSELLEKIHAIRSYNAVFQNSGGFDEGSTEVVEILFNPLGEGESSGEVG